MNRIEHLLNRKDKELLSVYFTAGFPHRDSTVEVIRALESEGVDMIEVGVPFSDPMADGKVIQQSSCVALENGMTLSLLFEQIAEARRGCNIPLVLMGYLNPLIQYGVKRLFERCREVGVDAIIVPDLPFKEYMEHYKPLCEKYGIPLVMLITPETSEERVRLMDENCGGFIYMVSSASTTGVKESFTEEQTAYFKRINELSLKNKRLIGFGISNRKTLDTAFGYSSGAIVGSLFVRCLAEASSVKEAVHTLMKLLKGDSGSN